MPADKIAHEISRDAYAKAIGDLVLNYIDEFHPNELSPLAEFEAFHTLCKIKTILDSDGLEDRECFCRIDRIIKALGESGIYTHRHDS
ncbi:hypothetical protein AALC17_08215 [Oscillospiraceae bacterium 38-13]